MDTFENLANMINDLPKELDDISIRAVKEQIDFETQRFANYLLKHSNSKTLNSQMQVSAPIYIPDVKYEREITWDDTTPVNELKGKRWGTYANRKRAPGKRNYSIAPATSHDLAYIINYGELSGKNFKGNYFITRGRRLLKGKTKRINIRFEMYSKEIAKKYE